MRRRLFEVEAELLRTLHALRYATTAQLHALYFQDRSLAACQTRLARLHKSGVLERQRLSHPIFSVAWSLGPEGLRELRRLRDGVFDPTKPLSRDYIPHLLATNQVYFGLAGGEWYSGMLPFTWRGSHRAELRMVSNHIKRVIHPDAIVCPRGDRAGPRVFLELDRSTERIRAKDGQRSIEGKLNAYAAYLDGRGSGRSSYQKDFKVARDACVLFVLEKIDSRDANPAGRDRRKRSILEAARRIFGLLYEPPVACLYLDEIARLREILKLPPATTRSPNGDLVPAKPSQLPASPAGLPPEQVDLLARFVGIVDAARLRLPHGSRVAGPLDETAGAVRQLLLGLGARPASLATFHPRGPRA